MHYHAGDRRGELYLTGTLTKDGHIVHKDTKKHAYPSTGSSLTRTLTLYECATATLMLALMSCWWAIVCVHLYACALSIKTKQQTITHSSICNQSCHMFCSPLLSYGKFTCAMLYCVDVCVCGCCVCVCV